MRMKRQTPGAEWKAGGHRKDGTPGNKGRWGGRRLAVGCQGKKKKK